MASDDAASILGNIYTNTTLHGTNETTEDHPAFMMDDVDYYLETNAIDTDNLFTGEDDFFTRPGDDDDISTDRQYDDDESPYPVYVDWVYDCNFGNMCDDDNGEHRLPEGLIAFAMACLASVFCLWFIVKAAKKSHVENRTNNNNNNNNSEDNGRTSDENRSEAGVAVVVAEATTPTNNSSVNSSTATVETTLAAKIVAMDIEERMVLYREAFRLAKQEHVLGEDSWVDFNGNDNDTDKDSTVTFATTNSSRSIGNNDDDNDNDNNNDNDNDNDNDGTIDAHKESSVEPTASPGIFSRFTRSSDTPTEAAAGDNNDNDSCGGGVGEDIESGMFAGTAESTRNNNNIYHPRTLHSGDSEARKVVPGSCVVCLEDFSAGDTVVWSQTPSCHHVFHKECMVSVLAHGTKRQQKNPLTLRKIGKHNPCPTCRQNFITVTDPMAETVLVKLSEKHAAAAAAAAASKQEEDATNRFGAQAGDPESQQVAHEPTQAHRETIPQPLREEPIPLPTPLPIRSERRVYEGRRSRHRQIPLSRPLPIRSERRVYE